MIGWMKIWSILNIKDIAIICMYSLLFNFKTSNKRFNFLRKCTWSYYGLIMIITCKKWEYTFRRNKISWLILVYNFFSMGIVKSKLIEMLTIVIYKAFLETYEVLSCNTNILCLTVTRARWKARLVWWNEKLKEKASWGEVIVFNQYQTDCNKTCFNRF